MPLHPRLKKGQSKILLLGSGALSIGQAGEFDYSGSQAIKALIEEEFNIIVINPNIATVQTGQWPRTKVYLYPLKREWIEKIIEIERPDALMAAFGGQTALNAALELEESGILAKYNILNLGTSLGNIRLSEDRDLFAKELRKIDVAIPPSKAATSTEEALGNAHDIGYPVIIRAAFALGGLGSGFAHSDTELKDIVGRALKKSPQVLVEKSLRGWKEIEYEVMRDDVGNCVTICNMENLDPLGVHTGDSIVIAPSQTLSDYEYQFLRNISRKIAEHFKIIGECNVQIALNPDSLEYFIIEINARLSRSSALASKASGYPIAYLAAKVAMGYSLLELRNPVTGVTSALFEPSFDYVTLKIPRWDLRKFKGVERSLGSTMKSVGEVMAVGRSFAEVLQKAVRMVVETDVGFTFELSGRSKDELIKLIQTPNDERLLQIIEAFQLGASLDDIHRATRIDNWFLWEVQELVKLATGYITTINSSEILTENASELFKKLPLVEWKELKQSGFSDHQLLLLAKLSPFTYQAEFRKLRISAGITPVFKKIDTTSGEHIARSNYLYSTYWGQSYDVESLKSTPSAVVLGGGVYRIGSSVEFDWCAVTSAKTINDSGLKSIIINCNPETVSTDFNNSDRLYFEELTLERILDIFDFEKSSGVFVCMGGQRPNSLALGLASAGLKLLGHSAETIDSSEDRNRFSQILDKVGIKQPRFKSCRNLVEATSFAEEIGYPILIRPSYVLSGTAMNVAEDSNSLATYLQEATLVSPDHPVLLTEFIENAMELELDGVAIKGKMLLGIVSEHLENAGVHSGDATLVYPPQRTSLEIQNRIKNFGEKISQCLNLNGPFNIQFIVKGNNVLVIECNARASRSFPFISKVTGINLAVLATQVALGKTDPQQIFTPRTDRIGIKAPMFSFHRLDGADPMLGVEMASTGEVGCIGKTFASALIPALESTGIKRPRNGILISAGRPQEKNQFLPFLPTLLSLGIPIYATPGTFDFYKQHGYHLNQLNWQDEGDTSILDFIRTKKIDFVINIPKNYQKRELSRGSQVRKTAVENQCSLITSIEVGMGYLQNLQQIHSIELTHL